MSDVTERLRYYDGEYLRAFDFEAEQAYHREMRRRLNRALHLFGIVSGLYLEEDEDSVKGNELFHIAPGMAIDLLGREIIVAAPRVLDKTVLAKKGLKPGPHGLWLVYKERAARPASPGYQACDTDDSSTRWREEFDIVFLPEGKSHSDGIQLGLVQLASATTGFRIDTVEDVNRLYVGINTQRILHPMFTDETVDPGALKPKAIVVPVLKPPDKVIKDIPPVGWLDVQPSAVAGRDLAVVGNSLFGEDFDKQDPVDLSKPPEKGNVKIDGNLYLRRPLQVLVDKKFKTIDEVIKSEIGKLVMPEFLSGTAEVAAKVVATTVSTSGEATLTLPSSTVANPSKIHCQASINAVKFNDKATVSSWWTSPNTHEIDVTATATCPSANSIQLVLSWVLDGNLTFTNSGPVQFVRLSYLLVLVP